MPSGSPETSSRTAPQKHSPTYVAISFSYISRGFIGVGCIKVPERDRAEYFRPSRCDPQDGHQGGAPSCPHDELGQRHGPLSNGRGDAGRIAGAARRWAARDQAEPRQRGQGVWKVETLASPRNRLMIRVLDATKDTSEELALDEFLERCVEYFEDGCVIDQPFQARLSEGVVRCYMAVDRCAGFGHQKVKALVDAPGARAEAGPRLYTSNADPRFQRLRRLMDSEWTPQLISLLDIPRLGLPMIWDADFMLRPRGADRTDSYVLGEINVSSVFPMPDEAPAEIARRVADRLRSKH